MPSSLRGSSIRAARDCNRCFRRKQTCDRVLPMCGRCEQHFRENGPHGQCLCFDPANAMIAAPHPQEPLAQPREPLTHCLNDRWRFTKRGHEQFEKLVLAPVDFVNKVPKDMKEFVQTLISDYGRTVDELLRDDIFKWFPIVESCYTDKYASKVDPTNGKDSDRFLPLLHMAILVVTSPPPTALSDGTVSHTDLYKAMKALFAVVSGNVMSHIHLVQTLGLVALYEFGVGCFEQAHITLTAAFTMANLAHDWRVDLEAQLTWKLCLITLDRMIALSTHSRPCDDINFLDPSKLPLACPSHHPVSKEVESLVRNYSRPSYRRNSERAIERLTSMHEGVVRAGRILQRKNLERKKHFYLSDSESESECESHTGPDDVPDRDRVKGIEKDKRGMMDQHGNPKDPEFWSGHDPLVLSLSAMLVYEYYAGQPADGHFTEPRTRYGESWRIKCEEAALKACRGVINIYRKKEVDTEKLSMVSMFCIMHNLTIIVKDPASNFACKFAKTFQPIMKKYAVRWPFALQYVNYLETYMVTASSLHRRYDC